MSYETPFSGLTCVLLAFLTAVLSAACLKILRTRKWRNILAEPVRPAARARRWARKLPPDLKLDSGQALFEVLYLRFRALHDPPAPDVLKLAIEGRPDASLSSSDLSYSKSSHQLTDDEKVATLVSVKANSGSLVPVDTFAHHALLNLLNVLKGKKKLKTGLEHAVLDSLGPSSGIAGAKLGGAIGLAMTPVTAGISVVLIPIWAVFGAWLCALAGKKVGSRFKCRRYYSAERKLKKVSRDFQKWFLANFPGFLAERERCFIAAMSLTQDLRRSYQNPITRFLFPSDDRFLSTELEPSEKRLAGRMPTSEADAKSGSSNGSSSFRVGSRRDGRKFRSRSSGNAHPPSGISKSSAGAADGAG